MTVSISLGKAGFLLTIPSETGLSHELEIPQSLQGLTILKRILSKREKEYPKIGNEGSPTQWQVEQWLKADRQARFEETKERLFDGLDLGELDL